MSIGTFSAAASIGMEEFYFSSWPWDCSRLSCSFSTNRTSHTTNDKMRCDDRRCWPVWVVCSRTSAGDQGPGGSCLRRTHVLLGPQHAGRNASPFQLDGNADRRPPPSADAGSVSGGERQSPGRTCAPRPLHSI